MKLYVAMSNNINQFLTENVNYKSLAEWYTKGEPHSMQKLELVIFWENIKNRVFIFLELYIRCEEETFLVENVNCSKSQLLS